jgi:hypothetical protein
MDKGRRKVVCTEVSIIDIDCFVLFVDFFFPGTRKQFRCAAFRLVEALIPRMHPIYTQSHPSIL